MDDLQKYLDQKLAVFKSSLEDELERIKEHNQRSLNKVLLAHIADAEKKIADNKSKYIATFQKDMAKLAKERESDPSNESMWEMHEKFIKDTFERKMRMSIKIWSSFIEDCKAKMK